jgi:hypothetical protein
MSFAIRITVTVGSTTAAIAGAPGADGICQNNPQLRNIFSLIRPKEFKSCRSV